MEDIREVALTYYANSSDEIKKVAKDFFKSMDADGNGVITFYEFKKFAKKNWGEFKPELFSELDKNGDGCLDYEEVIVFFYMSKMRFCFCAGCGQHLKNMYFTCVQCFENKSSSQTYDLCFTCYKTKHFTHEHNVFLDNYAMLTFMRPNDSKEKVAEPDGSTEKIVERNKVARNGGIERGRPGRVGQAAFQQASQQAFSDPDQADDTSDETMGEIMEVVGIIATTFLCNIM